MLNSKTLLREAKHSTFAQTPDCDSVSNSFFSFFTGRKINDLQSERKQENNQEIGNVSTSSVLANLTAPVNNSNNSQTIGHTTHGEKSSIKGAITVTYQCPPEIIEFVLQLMRKGAAL